MINGRRTLYSLATVFLLLACSDQQDTMHPLQQSSVMQGAEGEILGNVWDTEGRTTLTNYYVTLKAADAATQALLQDEHQITTMWVNPAAGSWQFEWFDVTATDGPCAKNPWNQYINGALVGPEVHYLGPGIPPFGLERHCVVPGSYVLTLKQGSTVIRSFRVDHLQIERDGITSFFVTNNSAGERPEHLAANSFDPTRLYTDLIVQIDLSPPTGSDTAELQVQNAGPNAYRRDFQAQAGIIEGTPDDAFRVSIGSSTSSWTRSGSPGEMLTRVFWDKGVNNANSTGYYDAQTSVHPIMRWHKYQNEITSTRKVVIAVNYMEPDDTPSGAADAKQTIRVIVPTNEVVGSVSVSPASTSVEPGGSAVFTGSAYSTTGQFMPGQQFTWSVTSGASISGSNVGESVTVIGQSNATVTATTSGVSGTAQLYVLPGPPATVIVSPTSQSVEVGGSASFSATAYASSGAVLSGQQFNWSVTGPASITSSTQGTSVTVVGNAVGTAAVTAAASNGVSGSGSLQVTAAPTEPLDSSFTVTPDWKNNKAFSFYGNGVADTYSWTYGDGSSYSGRYTFHTYSSCGYYTVTLTVTRGSQTASSSQEVAACNL